MPITPTTEYLAVGDVARQLGVKPSRISMLLYERRIADARCPIVGGRWLIPADLVPTIAMQLRRRGIRVTSPHVTATTEEADGAAT